MDWLARRVSEYLLSTGQSATAQAESPDVLIARMAMEFNEPEHLVRRAYRQATHPFGLSCVGCVD